MEIDIEEEDDTKLVFHINGAGHTFCNALKDELTNDDDVDIATYTIKHPLVAEPKFFIETIDGSPIEAMQDATTRLKERNESFKEQYEDLKTTA